MKKYTGIIFLLLCMVFSFTYAKAEEHEFTTSYYEDNNISAEISGTTLKLDFPDNGYFNFVMLQLNDGKGKSYNKEVFDAIKTVEYNIGNVPEGTYYLEIYTNTERYGTFTSYMYGKKGIKINISGKSAGFVMAETYEGNYRLYQSRRSDKAALEYYLKPSPGIESDHKDIISLSKKITKNCNSDYDKLKAIHDWVCNNIWYDYDFLYGRSSIASTGALETLKSKKSVCHGYATLTAALLRASGIPAKVVAGYALGVTGGSEWTDGILSLTEGNHAWNEAYVDERWVILDTTWDSNHRYEYGKFSEGTGLTGYKYFDISVELLSYDHRIMSDDTEADKAVGPAPGPEVKETRKTLYVGYENYKLKIDNLSPDAVITYKSSNKRAATVTDKGIVKPVKKGTATITATIKQKGRSYTFKVDITVKNPYVKITGSTDELSVGKSIKLKAKTYGLKNPVIEWTSSDKKIATVGKTTGKVAAKAAGNVTITATDTVSGKKASVTIKVVK